MIDIVIPTYNRADKCLNQVESIYRQLYRNDVLCSTFNVHVSDNASSDDYGLVSKACSQYGFIYRRFNVNTASVGNQCRASLLGTSRYKWVLSDDDPLKDKALLKIYSTLSLLGRTDILLLNDAPRLSSLEMKISLFLRHLRICDPLALSSNTLISSFIFNRKLFDHSLFWSMEDRWFPLSLRFSVVLFS